jgi:NitT/TauT family transport system substrate-binding protein
MLIVQSRRRFLTDLGCAGVAAIGGVGVVGVGGRTSLAEEPPPEITTIRFQRAPSATCIAPVYVADELLRAEGFTDIRYELEDKPPLRMLARNELDWTLEFAPAVIREVEAGAAATIVAGVHVGCFELFAQEHIHSMTDLKGRTVGVSAQTETPKDLVSIMANYVGLDPDKDINWVYNPSARSMELFIERKIDALFASPPRAQELRARNIGHSIVNSSTDHPWAQYFCCMLTGRTEFVRSYPVATKRVLRAILKAAELCATEPERAAQLLVDRGFTPRLDYALQGLSELPYKVWRDYDPEDTVRWYALRLNEAGFTKSSPQAIIAEHTDWHFLNELKRELKV